MKLKITTTQDLSSKKPAEIQKYITELKQSYNELVRNIHTNKETKTHQLGQIRKAVAQAKTVQTQQQRSKDKE